MPPTPSKRATVEEAARPQIQEILGLLGQATERWEAGAAETKRWMADKARSEAVAETVLDSTPAALQVIDAIGRLEPVNGITISHETRLPKGSVSKITQRLVTQKLARKKALPNNKKEVLFQLTPRGREVWQVHRAFDAQMERGFVRFLQRYQPGELELLIRVLRDFTQASMLDM